MTIPSISFEKLELVAPKWESSYTGEESAYRFTIISDNILELESVGVFNDDLFNKQIAFINQFSFSILKNNQNRGVILVWDLSMIKEIKSLKRIFKLLDQIDVCFVSFVIPQNIRRIYMDWIVGDNKNASVKVYKNKSKAISSALSLFDIDGNVNKNKFEQIWHVHQKKVKVDSHLFKYVELPEWHIVDKIIGVKVACQYFKNNIIYVNVVGRVEAVVVNDVFKIINKIEKYFNLDFKNNSLYLIFNFEGVTHLSYNARRLAYVIMKRATVSTKVILILNNKQKNIFSFLFSIKQNGAIVESAKNIKQALVACLSEGSNRDLIEEESEELPLEYDDLKKMFLKQKQEIDDFKRKSQKQEQKLLALIELLNSGEFLNTSIIPDYSDTSVFGSIVNALVLLKQDIKQQIVLPQINDNYEFNDSTIEHIINSFAQPVFIYQNKYIRNINESFANLLSGTQSQFIGQPIVSVFSPLEILKIETELEQIAMHNSIDTYLVSTVGEMIEVSLQADSIMIGDSPAQFVLVFVKNRAKSEQTTDNNLSELNTELENVEKDKFEYHNLLINCSLSFYVEYVLTVDEFVENIEDKSYKNILSIHQSIVFLSQFLQENLIIKHDVDRKQNSLNEVSLGLIVNNLYTIFSDYIKFKEKFISFQFRKYEYDIYLSDELSFVINHILIYLLKHVINVTNGNIIEFGYVQSTKEHIEFFIETNGDDFNINNQLIIKNKQYDLSIFEIEKALNIFGGKIFIESSPESGSRLSIIINSNQLVNKVEVQIPDYSKYSILLVDDVQMNLDILKIALDDTGATIYSALNYEQALTIVKTNKVDIVITDLQMPDKDGEELASTLKKILPQLSVICTSAYSHNVKVRSKLDRVGDAFVAKPIEINVLYEEISKVLMLS